MRLSFLMLAVPVAVAAAPPAADRRPLLWQDLRAGMSPNEIERLHPGKSVPLTPGCPARLKPLFSRGGLSEVMLFLEPSRACTNAARALLNQRHGQPVGFGTLSFVGAMSTLSTDNAYWRDRSVVVALRVKKLSGTGTLSFTLAPPGK